MEIILALLASILASLTPAPVEVPPAYTPPAIVEHYTPPAPPVEAAPPIVDTAPVPWEQGDTSEVPEAWSLPPASDITGVTLPPVSGEPPVVYDGEALPFEGFPPAP